MTAADVREALLKRWPPSEYLTIEEAPQDSMRQGRKIDLLVVSLWKSRGHGLDAVEVKVSMSDWKRELENAAKADWWWTHTHRFWVAVPLAIAPKVRNQLPESWGLIACTEDGGSKIVVQAPKHEPEPLPWTSCIGVMRATSGAGANALLREFDRGLSAGRERGVREAELNDGGEALTRLRERVQAVEEATGIPIARWSSADREQFGWSREAFLAALSQIARGQHTADTARTTAQHTASALRRAADELDALTRCTTVIPGGS